MTFPKCDFHTHTTFSDGSASPEKMVEAAIGKGMEAIGFSDHALTGFDLSYCMLCEKRKNYCSEILRLKEKYRGKIEIFLGLEKDAFSDPDPFPYDYTIGSVHYFEVGDVRIAVDCSDEIQREAARAFFHGDALALAENYFESVGRVLETTGADLIGHFDLLTKFCEGSSLFDRSSPRYRAAWRKAADRLLETGKPFEVNTGAISRGYRSSPYPDDEILAYLAERGASFVLSGDAHSPEALMCSFGEAADRLEAVGAHPKDFRSFLK